MLNVEYTGLILVDVQGNLARKVHESEATIKNIKNLLKGCQILDIPVVWLEQNPDGLGSTIEEIAEHIIDNAPIGKFCFNAMAEKEVENKIKALNKQNWIICGIEAHICVYQTVMGLIGKNYTVEVVADAISSRKEENIDVALRKFERAGVGITNVEMCLYELMRTSKRKEFKEILSLIK
ncbi:hydrolase [Flammeovirga sp. EKP202]|uniref:hydrolase n=1 Tax=Flammeovirga sp. EKP202 TaxID=2770592 RepID=UPI00165FE7D8|nr:hydrolase [Flammeovirga sp. EKP202]MBD0403288.1 hydrolase [Flammeovirga sp. EKP202]